MDLGKWTKLRSFAEVKDQAGSVVADCGSPSVPRNQENAKLISRLPDILEIFEELVMRIEIQGLEPKFSKDERKRYREFFEEIFGVEPKQRIATST